MGESSGLFDTPICISYFVTGSHNFGRVDKRVFEMYDFGDEYILACVSGLVHWFCIKLTHFSLLLSICTGTTLLYLKDLSN